jgi:hypothetical protein
VLVPLAAEQLHDLPAAGWLAVDAAGLDQVPHSGSTRWLLTLHILTSQVDLN